MASGQVAAQEAIAPEPYQRVFALVSQGEYSLASAVADSFRAATAVRTGESGYDFAYALHAWAYVRLQRGDAKDEMVLEAAERAAEAFADLDAPIRASVLHTIGAILDSRGDAEGAAAAYRRAIEAQRGVSPPEDRANTMSGLAIALANLGRLEEALQYFEQSREILEQTLGPSHTDVARAEINLATLYRILGRHDESLESANRAVEIYAAAYGDSHPVLATALTGRGNVYMAMGRLREARADYQRSLSMRATDAPDAWRRAYDISGLGLVEMQMGLYEEALAHHEEARELFASGVGSTHALVSYPLVNLALCSMVLGRVEAAIEHAIAAREIIAQPGGSNTPRFASVTAVLGHARTLAGHPEQALPELRFAVSQLDSIYGSDHEAVVDARRYLAIALERSGRYQDALAVADAAVRGGESLPRGGHHLASALAVRASVRLLAGDASAALDDGLLAETLSREDYRAIVQSLSERAAQDFGRARADGLGFALSALADGVDSDADAILRTWDAVVRSRALLLDELVARRRMLAATKDPASAVLAEEVVSARTTLAAFVVRGVEGDPDAYMKTLEAARRRKDRAESALAEHSIAFRNRAGSHEIGLKRIVERLGDDEALISVCRYERLMARGLRKPFYAGFVHGPDGSSFVDLGSAEAIDALIERWRATIADGRVPTGPLATHALAANRAAGRELRAVVLDELLERARSAATIHLVLDSQLHLLNPAALPNDSNGWLVESEQVFHLLGAERELAIVPDPPPIGGLLAIGAPDFDRSGEPELASNDDLQLRGLPSSCERFRDLRFSTLRGARLECEGLVELWRAHRDDRTQLLLGSDATESKLIENAGGQAILHIATHAYVMDAGCIAADDSQGAEDALVLSGLALGGANRRDSARNATMDGILTGEEVALLDLEGTGWVVLSGCDTGLGEIAPGDGVYGLRRAFRGAGARTVILSLWPVEDAATAGWMDALYRSRLREGRSTPEAMKLASRAVLDQRRRDGLSEHPFWWAGFIAVGDPR